MTNKHEHDWKWAHDRDSKGTKLLSEDSSNINDLDLVCEGCEAIIPGQVYHDVIEECRPFLHKTNEKEHVTVLRNMLARAAVPIDK